MRRNTTKDMRIAEELARRNRAKQDQEVYDSYDGQDRAKGTTLDLSKLKIEISDSEKQIRALLGDPVDRGSSPWTNRHQNQKGS